MRLFHTLALAAVAAGPCAAAGVSYRAEIEPILAQRCRACHQEGNASGGIDLSTHASLFPVRGRVLDAISGDRPRMPKAGAPLTREQATTIRLWIEQGASNDGPVRPAPSWWSQRPIARATPPAGGPPIDAFIAAALSARGLTPSPEAERRTLIRRVTFDLHGIPPAPAEIDAFLADRSAGAYERLVDRLLASPRYGERWARHWLDVVHYGDSHGYDKDKPRANAWPYRDYVIASLNSDKPYPRFVEEQLAGDILYPDDPAATIATGFIAAGPWDFVGHQELREGTSDKAITRNLDRDDMVAATMSTFVSQTVHCARCHDHKFDPIRQSDYYAAQAVFAGVDRADRPYDADPAVAGRRRSLIEQRRAVQIELQPLLDEVDNASTPEIDQLDFRIKDARFLITHIGEPKNDAEAAEKKRLQAQAESDAARRKVLLDAFIGPAKYAAIDRLNTAAKSTDDQLAALPKPSLVYAAASYFPRAGTFRPPLTPRPIHVLNRGSVDAPGEPATAGSIGVRFDLPPGAPEGARRAALARWITAGDNPHTWRTIVNRVWHYHFGAGLVDTPSDFGRMGSQPSHPELLDYLAAWFRDDARGSIKQLHKLILMSATYRQSSADRPGAAKIDADNRLLWRMNRTRLDAESIRDSILAVSGKLDLTMGGPGVRQFWFKDDHSPVYDYARFDPDDPAAFRRSIYRFIVRSAPDPFMDRLDCPDASLLTPKRSTTLTAIQALAMLNNPFVVRMAEHLAARVTASGGGILEAHRLALGRDPSPAERATFEAFAQQHGLANACRLLFNSNEFAFID